MGGDYLWRFSPRNSSIELINWLALPNAQQIYTSSKPTHANNFRIELRCVIFENDKKSNTKTHTGILIAYKLCYNPSVNISKSILNLYKKVTSAIKPFRAPIWWRLQADYHAISSFVENSPLMMNCQAFLLTNYLLNTTYVLWNKVCSVVFPPNQALFVRQYDIVVFSRYHYIWSIYAFRLYSFDRPVKQPLDLRTASCADSQPFSTCTKEVFQSERLSLQMLWTGCGQLVIRCFHVSQRMF